MQGKQQRSRKLVNKMKDAYYFPHDCNARNDQKLIAVRAKHGMKGYGIYFGLIEMLREANLYQIPSKINLLAFDLREDEKDIKDVLENYDLFKTNGEVFWSETLNERMGHLSEVREKRRLAGSLGGLAKANNLLQQNPSKSLPVKESKVKESILAPKQYLEGGGFKPPTLAEVTEYCVQRDNGVDPEYFINHYSTTNWFRGKTKIKDWRACVRNWEKNNPKQESATGHFR